MTASPQAPSVTDHALVRFLARSGLDVEAVRRAIEESLARAHGAAIALGNPDHLIVVGKLSFVVRAGKVTTILPTPRGPRDHAQALRPQIPE